LPQNLVDFGEQSVVGGGKHMVGDVDIESSQQQIGPDSMYPYISIAGGADSVLSKILYFSASFSPSILNPVATEQHFHKQEAETAIHHRIKF